MLKKTLTATAIGASGLLLVAAGASPALAAGPELVTFGGFNSVQYQANNGTFAVGETIGGWEVGGPTSVADQALRIYWDGVNDGNPANAAPFTDGGYARLVGSMAQTLQTEAGKTYQLTYNTRKAGVTPTSGGGWTEDHPTAVLINGTQIHLSIAPAAPEYGFETVSFTATGPTTELKFQSNNAAAVGIDNVSVQEAPENNSPIMLPAIAGGIGIAALGAGSAVALRRKNKVAGE